MAKRRRSQSVQIVRAAPIRTPSPIIRIQQPRASGGTTKRRRSRGRGRSRAAHSLSGGHLLGIGLGGAIFGFAEKTFGASLPAIPVLGRKGAITLGLYFLGKHMGGSFVKDAAIAGAAICGYELGKDGKVSGIDGDVDGVDGDVASNVSGVASQF